MTLKQWASNGWLRPHETCRKEYDYAGAATRKDAQELIEFCKELREAVIAWLEREHIELTLPEDKH